VGPNGRPKTTWEYSEKAIALIKEYKSLFPEVFAAVERNPNAREYDVSELFDSTSPSPQVAETTVEQTTPPTGTTSPETPTSTEPPATPSTPSTDTDTTSPQPSSEAVVSPKEKLLLLTSWLSKSPAAHLELVSCDSLFLSEEQLRSIEEKAIEITTEQAVSTKTISKVQQPEDCFYQEYMSTSTPSAIG